MYARIAPASACEGYAVASFHAGGSWDESMSSNLKSAELAAAAEVNSKMARRAMSGCTPWTIWSMRICRADA